MALTKQTISTDELSTFGARLRWAREEQGLSRPALSKWTDRAISPRVIDHLENGTTDVTARRAELLSDALGVERNWLMFGEPAMTNHANENPVSAPGDTPAGSEEVPDDAPKALKSAPGGPKKALEAARKRLGVLGALEEQGSAPADTGEQEGISCSAAKDTAIRQYFDAMNQTLLHVDKLREDGLKNHPRKLPKLLEKAVEIGLCLEQSDIEELAGNRSMNIADFSSTNLSQETFAEIVLRLIDTALLGVDLYELDLDVLKAFAKKADVGSPFFGWKDQTKIVPSIREVYWEKALKGDLRLTTSLHHAG